MPRQSSRTFGQAGAVMGGYQRGCNGGGLTVVRGEERKYRDKEGRKAAIFREGNQ